MATDKEVEKKQQDVAKLRQKIVEEQDKLLTNVRESDNAIVLAQLEREEAILQAEYDALHEQAKVSTQRAAAKEQAATIIDGPAEPDLDAQTLAAEGK